MSKILLVIYAITFFQISYRDNSGTDKIISSQVNIFEKLKSLPGVEVKEIEPDSIFKEAYEVYLKQPLDHQNPEGKGFTQRIFLSHTGISKPVLFDTEGYAVRQNYIFELSGILGANQIIVEHRYFGESKPDSMDWKYLTVAQAAADHHRIIGLFKEIYKGKWVSSGISKGGQTAIFHRRYYPNDVDVTVPYVAPLNLEQEDTRIHFFLKTVGDEDCRNKIKQFQKTLLENRGKLLHLFDEYSKQKEYEYSIVGSEAAFEYIVLEYDFAFWQWGNTNCSEIPKSDVSPEEMFDHLKTAVPFYYYSDAGIKYLEPFMYQAYTELGYYGYDTSDFKDLLKVLTNGSNIIFAPKNVSLTFNPEVMKDINEWLQNEGNNFLYIYGEVDTWSACAVELSGKTNALKFVKTGGSHGTRIRHLSEEQKEKVFSTLEKWLDVEIER